MSRAARRDGDIPPRAYRPAGAPRPPRPLRPVPARRASSGRQAEQSAGAQARLPAKRADLRQARGHHVLRVRRARAQEQRTPGSGALDVTGEAVTGQAALALVPAPTLYRPRHSEAVRRRIATAWTRAPRRA